MKRNYSFLGFLLVIGLISITALTAGISKDSRYGGGSMVEELYDQAIKQNDNLKSIEDGIERFYRKKEEALEKYNSYTSYNYRYYADAKSKAATIADPAIKQRAIDLINKSEGDYLAKLNNWKTEITSLSARETELNSLHLLLKIMTTLPAMHKYQNSSLPDMGKYKDANADLQQLIEKIKAITK